MTLRVVFRPAARTEFDTAALWYEERQPGLGARFVAAIDHAVGLASAYPDRFPVVHGAVRRVQAQRFPYSVYFLSGSDRIVVIAVFHARRNPSVWKTRK